MSEPIPSEEIDLLIMTVADSLAAKEGRVPWGYIGLTQGLRHAKSTHGAWSAELCQAWETAIAEFQRRYPRDWYL